MKNMLLIITIAGLIMLSFGCATVSTNTNVSDFVLMSTETNSDTLVAVLFSSDLSIDHQVSIGGIRTPSKINMTFNQMLNEYAFSKFPNQSIEAPTKISVHLQDYTIEQNMEGNEQAKAIFFGTGEASVEAKLRGYVLLTINGEEMGRQNIVATEIVNYQTGSSTNLGRVYGNCGNKCVNKALFIINNFLKSKDL